MVAGQDGPVGSVCPTVRVSLFIGREKRFDQLVSRSAFRFLAFLRIVKSPMTYLYI